MPGFNLTDHLEVVWIGFWPASLLTRSLFQWPVVELDCKRAAFRGLDHSIALSLSVPRT